jgi:hypothetical protein
MNKTILKCRVRKSNGGFEGTVSVPGLKPSKLTKKDESTVYANKSGIASAAKALADRFSMTLELEDTTDYKKKTPAEVY